jgi:LysR family transcriptional regulator, hydrogen peroxide-inducible genes activator
LISNKQLQYALCVQKTLHFKKAAELCFVSQAALSIAISELEKHLGFAIFERDNKKVIITALGRIFLHQAQHVSLQLADLEKLSRANKAPFSLPMTIGMIPTVCPYLLPLVLPILRRDYPNFQLNIIEETSSVLVDKVKQGEIDTAILALPFDIQGLLSFSFWQEDFYYVTHKDTIKNKIETVSSEYLKSDKLLLLKEGHCLTDHALAVCHLTTEKRVNHLSSTSLHSLVQLVACQIGSTFVPKMALSSLVANHRALAAFPLSEQGPHRQLAFILRPTYPNLAEIDELKKIFISALMTA